MVKDKKLQYNRYAISIKIIFYTLHEMGKCNAISNVQEISNRLYFFTTFHYPY